VDLPGLVGHPAFPRTMEALVSRPRGTVLDVARAALERTDDLPEWTVKRARLLAPILPPSLSEEDHRWLANPGGEISRPPGNGETRFDLEAGAVIFRPKKLRLRPSDARDCIFGYTLMHSWFTDESFAASIGPCIVTADEFDDLAPIEARVNGKPWSVGTIGDARTSFEDQIVAAARTAELRPGEVFGSGTLGRVAGAKQPRAHATVELTHPSIGLLRNQIGPRVRKRTARKAS
jgi:2-keto-4-pentenoate hydratase/2-oxohepta-3-ene-1,7-dioic acid hydratase in catechol pathway